MIFTRFTQPPADLLEWFEDYLDDEEVSWSKSWFIAKQSVIQIFEPFEKNGLLTDTENVKKINSITNQSKYKMYPWCLSLFLPPYWPLFGTKSL